MEVAPLLLEVDVHLVAHHQLVVSVAYPGTPREHLVAVADVDALETSADIPRDGVGRTVSHTGVHPLLVVLVDHPCSDVCPVGGAIVSCQYRCRYCNKRIAELDIVSAREVTGRVHLHLVGLAQRYGRPGEVLSTHADVPLLVDIVEAEAYIERIAAELCLGESRVVAVVKVNLCPIKILHNEPELHTGRNHASEEIFAKRILSSNALVGECANLVVQHRCPHSVILPQEVEGQVGPHIERVRVVLVAGKSHRVGTHGVELVALSRCGWVVRGLHQPIMAEYSVVLRLRTKGGKQRDEYGNDAFKHISITLHSPFYCHDMG